MQGVQVQALVGDLRPQMPKKVKKKKKVCFQTKKEAGTWVETGLVVASGERDGRGERGGHHQVAVGLYGIMRPQV